jgi:4-carboxymuconolactone decarboxylase
MADKDIRKAGLDLRRHMFGKSGAEDRVDNASDFMRWFEETVITDFCFGDVWNRAPLDHKTRSMLTVAILAALGKSPQLRYHVQGAIANGVSTEELREVLIQVTLYAGIPCGAEGFTVSSAVLKEMGLD